ncbi:alpha/beta fold hydrolase [Sphingomonas nostoxanthinifaciens]|uniref:alpha/beta fold hydrolase n=1 Tax=Sphingomonas nostoxanthinifaciens TaxID=2872652 RepID=UPI001CC20099|nr:alpha/beta hydrolase [Sphingomonas nostoxanthinifaciens]UAK25398.1 alpha/beta hydrolase [Sphingomonas nostoxanthinifaciens]
MPYIKTRDHVDLYVKDWGDGRPVILLHGWPLNADSWDDQALALANAGYRVIAYDRRGFGRSSQPFTGYDYDTLADDLAQVIDATGATDATLVGFSMGGGEVARYMSRYDGKGLVAAGLISSVVPYLLKDDTNKDGVDGSVFEDQMKAPIRQDRPKFLHSFAEMFYGVGYISSPVSQQMVDYFVTLGLQGGLPGTLACIDSFGKTDFRGDLPAFRVPTLIVHGTSDKVVPIDTAGRAAARGIAQATLVEYDGAPHGLNVTEKDRLTDDLLTFVRA